MGCCSQPLLEVNASILKGTPSSCEVTNDLELDQNPLGVVVRPVRATSLDYSRGDNEVDDGIRVTWLEGGKVSESLHCLRVEFESEAGRVNERQIESRHEDVVIRPCQSEKLSQLGGFARDSQGFAMHVSADSAGALDGCHDGLQVIQEELCHELANIVALVAPLRLETCYEVCCANSPIVELGNDGSRLAR